MTESKPANTNEDAITEQAMYWFSRLRAEDVTAREREQFSDWYRATAAHRQAYDAIDGFWQNDAFTQVLSTIPLSAATADALRRRRRFRRMGPLLALAACLALVQMIYRPALHCLTADYCTGIGEMRSVQLADGSRVTLNSDSALTVAFANDKRVATLSYGEAFFEVARNPQQPFLVDSRHSTTRVLGTRFIVRGDKQSDTISVVSGVVEVTPDKKTASVLKANDSITVTAEHSGEIRRVAAGNIGAWLKGSATFDNVPLQEVVAELGRYRRGSILIKDDGLKDLKVSGRFNITDTDKALDALQQTLPIKLYRFTPLLVVIG